MTGQASSVRAFVVCGLMLVAAGCTTGNKLDVQTASASSSSTPGTEQDFIVNVGDRVFFPTDVTSLTDSGKETLRRQAAWLKLYPDVKILVEGHSDERGTREYNLALSGRRGTNSKNYIVSQGISPDRVRTISYGKERPVALCDAESCWSQNRRAVTVVTDGAGS